MESLTMEDIDMYTMISRRIQHEDVYSIVDTYLMPYGIECDQYSLMGGDHRVQHHGQFPDRRKTLSAGSAHQRHSSGYMRQRKRSYGDPGSGQKI